ncbi:hypothetical protein ACFYSF_45755 [Streptomyces canus]|uniref:hypothetical protein n=1 Tax=Streptomyces canus TaxID=58343 RepID=UPI00367A0C7A
MLLPDFDGVRGAGELPAVGAFADVLDDDVVDEVVLELVVGEFAGEPEFLDRVPVAPAAVDPQGRGVDGAARAYVVAGFDDAADLVLAVCDVVGERVGGDDGDVLVRGVDDVQVAAAECCCRNSCSLLSGGLPGFCLRIRCWFDRGKPVCVDPTAWDG